MKRWTVLAILLMIPGCRSEEMNVSGLTRVGGTGGAHWAERRATVVWLFPSKLESSATWARSIKTIGPCEVEIIDVHGVAFRKVHERIPLAYDSTPNRWLLVFTFTPPDERVGPWVAAEDGNRYDSATGALDAKPPRDRNGRFFDPSSGVPRHIRVRVAAQVYFEWNPTEEPDVILK